jgi:UDP:flavonoid glycosyltransferase YjiC (YdhE family)
MEPLSVILLHAMRILFTFIGGTGHLLPLLPVACAARVAGHTVAVGCGPAMAATVTASGLTVLPLSRGSATPKARLPLRPVDLERERREFRDRFARQGARARAPLVLTLCAEWRPDVLVCDETDFGSLVAAERLGIPYAAVLVMAAGTLVQPDVIGDALQDLRAEHGLPPDPNLEMLRRYLVLAPFPVSYRDPAYPLPATAHAFAARLPPVAGRPTAWDGFRPEAPTVYFTLGTVFNVESGDLFSRVLAGLRELPVNVVVTVGPHIDPAAFGAQPAHIQVRTYVAQDTILPHCQLVISHGGSGSVLGALAHGRPMVLIPMGADQPLNAARCEQLGVGWVLDPVALAPIEVQAAVQGVLAAPNYRLAAERMRADFAALPEPAHAVALLERLAANAATLGMSKAL